MGGGETGSMYVLSYEVPWYVHIYKYNSMVRACTSRYNIKLGLVTNSVTNVAMYFKYISGKGVEIPRVCSSALTHYHVYYPSSKPVCIYFFQTDRAARNNIQYL